jgi:hypothetical protein
VRYCRNEGREYVIGVQRDAEMEQLAESNALPEQQNAVEKNALLEQKTKEVEISEGEKKTESAPPAHAAEPQFSRHEVHRELVKRELIRHETSRNQAKGRDRPPRSAFERDEKSEVPRDTELRVEKAGDETRERKEAYKEGKQGKHMTHKWMSSWHSKPDEPGTNREEPSNGSPAKENVMPPTTLTIEKPAASFAREVPNFQVELLPMEDIYRTAGIVTPRKGYSVTKVVEMLNSEHIRELSRETKRAAILMALDAAGLTVEQVQRDARARQSALDAYENEQKKQVEAEWARKAEEITHIQAELESIKAHYTARISRNMEALARDKARFNNWVTTKEQESQSMSEALELCLKSPGSEPVAAREREMSAAAASSVAVAASAAKPV